MCSISASALFILTTEGKCQPRDSHSCHDSNKPSAYFQENQPVKRQFFPPIKHKTNKQKNTMKLSMHHAYRYKLVNSHEECMLLEAGNAMEI